MKDEHTILQRILNAYSPVDEAATSMVLDAAEIESYRKNEVIFHERRFNAFEYFQLDGIAHRYNTDEDGRPLTTGIYQNEIVITPHFARTTNGQSIFSLQALADCTYLKIPAGMFLEMRERKFATPRIRTGGR